jgi:A/G-specific adenine glycosylase
MDLGATVCTPRKPRCMLCPWRADCAGKAAPERYPAKAAEKAKPLRSAAAFFVTRVDGAIWLRRRPPHGLLGGMLEVPSAAWLDGAWDDARGLDGAPPGLDFAMLPGLVRHGFTHFALELKVFAARGERLAGEWWPVDRLGEAALPSLMRKVVAHGLEAAARGAAPAPATPAPPAASGAARRSARGGRRG